MSSNMMEYGCVVDAGSSGSRIFLYQWPKHGDGPTEEVFNEEITPGISDQEHGLAALQELVTQARNALRHYHTSAYDVPIYLGATAGLRLVDSPQKDMTMFRVRQMLHTSDFMFQDNWARIISGEDEGIYEWITINYIKNGGALPDRLSTTFGALDLGGASTQISFRSRGRRLLRRKEAFPLQIHDSKYELYSHSFLHYGADEARAKHSRHIAADKTQNPCYPVGYVDEETNLSGSSNWDECLRSVSGMMLVEAHNLTTDISDGELYSNLLNSYEYVIAGSTLVLMLLTSLVLRRRWRKIHRLPHVMKAQAL